MTKIEQWLAEFVNTDDFHRKLEAEINALEDEKDRLKIRLELLSYVVPKIKGIDPLTPDQTLQDIKIVYKAAPAPKKAKGAP